MFAAKRSPVRASFAALVAIPALVITSGSLRAGIPEPDLVWYGKVLTTAGGSTVRLTSGRLDWQIVPLSGGAPWVLTTQLANVNDQFSFVLRVPCESPEPGAAASGGIVVLSAPPNRYGRVTVTLNGQPLTLQSAPAEIAPVAADRGRSDRIDLVLGTVEPDTDGDGMADSWEQQHFGGLTASPGDDADGDGVSNLREYLAGTDPKNSRSLFEVVEIKPVAGGIRLRWSSQPNRVYRVQRSTSLLAAPASFQTIQAGVAGTPPMNEFVDTTPGDGSRLFYRIEIE